MDNKLKRYKKLVWVEVAFGQKYEILYYEATREEFEVKRATLDYAFFPIHNRNVFMNF